LASSALVIRAARVGQDDLISAVLDDFSPLAIEDLIPQPLPPGGLWDPTFPPPPEPPPAPAHWRAFFATGEARAAAAEALRAQLPDVTLESADVDDENWAARSQASLTAIRAGAFIVAPPWNRPREVEAGVTVVVIEPSRGFGTGHHASTRVCLRALSEVEMTGRRVLDLGTGSGVLAMAAAMKGAREVIAVDIDPDAIESARASAGLNQLPIEIEWLTEDFREAGLETGLHRRPVSDLVVANLTGGMLRASAERIQSLINPGGLLVISGFDETERDAVRQAFSPFDLVRFLSEEGWVSLVLRS
jgi:ribosomal protein L11 methyltransferase